MSPFAAASSVPLVALNIDADELASRDISSLYVKDWGFVIAYFVATLAMNGVLMALMIWLFNRRWRVSQ